LNLFDVGYLAGGVLLSPVWARKKRAGWGERFGRIDHMTTRRAEGGEGRPRVVLHAVSVGETAACRTLVPLLAEKADVIVSVTTDTGLERARSLYGGVCDVVRTPLDFSWAVRRFLDKTRPDVLGLVELEVWPNLVRGLCGAGACRSA
jgi:3-deoxy-D-manno-octulosonic-acid transferase